MAIQRMDNVLIVVEDLDAVVAFLVELGMELEGTGEVGGAWVEQVIGLSGVRQDVAMLRVPGQPGRIELARFHTPGPVRPEPAVPPVNTLGLRRVMFEVDDIEDTVARLRGRGAELVGGIARYTVDPDDPGVDRGYLLCYVRGPEGLLIGLAQPLSDR